MKRHIIAGASALAAIAGVAFAGTATAAPDTDPVLVDIRVELDQTGCPCTQGPAVWDLTSVPVTDGVELENVAATSDPSEWWGDITVDISTDLQTVTITGGDDYYHFDDAVVTITLHGYTWGAVTPGADDLFQDDEPELQGAPQLGVNLGGGKGILTALRLAVTEIPSLQSATVSGSVFTAHWQGLGRYDMAGSATFAFGAPQAIADGAAPVPADPDYTG